MANSEKILVIESPQNMKIVICLMVVAHVSLALNCSFANTDACINEYQFDSSVWRRHIGPLMVDSQTILSESPAGVFLYLSGDNGRKTKDDPFAEVVSPKFELSGPGCMGFLYKNNWCDASAPSKRAFRVLLRPADGTDDILLRDYLCVDSNEWLNEEIALMESPGNYSLVFRGNTPQSANHVIALDHVQYTPASCAVQSDSTFMHGECDFEGSDMCWYEKFGAPESSAEWFVARKEMFRHRSPKTRAPSGHFVMVLLKNEKRAMSSKESTISLITPVISVPGSACLIMTYFNWQSDPQNATSSLLLRKLPASRNFSQIQSDDFVIHRFSDLVEHWSEQRTYLPSGTYRLVFEATVTQSYNGNPSDVIAFDDVTILQTACDGIRRNTIRMPCKAGAGECVHGHCVLEGTKRSLCNCDYGRYGRKCQFGVGVTQMNNSEQQESSNSLPDSKNPNIKSASTSKFPMLPIIFIALLQQAV